MAECIIACRSTIYPVLVHNTDNSSHVGHIDPTDRSASVLRAEPLARTGRRGLDVLEAEVTILIVFVQVPPVDSSL